MKYSLAYDSGLAAGSVLATVRRLSDNKMRVTSGGAFENNNNAHVATYAVVLTDQGGDLWTFDITIDAGTYLVIPYYEPTLTLTTSSGRIEGGEETIQTDGTAITSGSPGTNVFTIGMLVTILQDSARNAGLTANFASGDPYTLTQGHIAIRDSVNDFIRRTRCTRSTSSVTLADTTNTVDLSGLAGFALDRIFNIWTKPSDSSSSLKTHPLTVVDYNEILEFRQCGTTSSCAPRHIGFPSLATLIGETDTDASEDILVYVNWWPPLVSFILGDTGSTVANTVVNVPGDLVEEVIRTKGVMNLQRNQPAQLKEAVIQGLKADYEAHVSRNMGANNMGVRSIRRQSLDEIRRERRGGW